MIMAVFNALTLVTARKVAQPQSVQESPISYMPVWLTCMSEEMCMTSKYSDQAQRILSDLFVALENREDMDPAFFSELRCLEQRGMLGNHNRVQQTIANLKAGTNELQD